jgi:hypothetical protein
VGFVLVLLSARRVCRPLSTRSSDCSLLLFATKLIMGDLGVSSDAVAGCGHLEGRRGQPVLVWPGSSLVCRPAGGNQRFLPTWASIADDQESSGHEGRRLTRVARH